MAARRVAFLRDKGSFGWVQEMYRVHLICRPSKFYVPVD